MEALQPLTANWVAFICGFLGILAHFLKKKVRGQSLSSITNYFGSHFSATILAVGGYFGLFFGLAAAGPISIPAAILAGYSADSFFNKADGDK